MIRRLLAALADQLLRTDIPATWRDEPELDAAIRRHPAGKGLRPGDPPPAA